MATASSKIKSNACSKKISRFFNAKTIVVIGGSEAAKVVMQSRLLGYAGKILAVNPSRDSIAGIACYKTIDDLAKDTSIQIDAAFIAIPSHASVEIVAKLARMDCAGVVCYASGFAEHNQAGKVLQKQLIENAADMALVGPNCYGFIDYANKLCLWPDYHGGEPLKAQQNGVAIITQSGNMGINMTMQKRGLPLSCIVSTGNQAGLTIADYIRHFASQEQIKAIGIHIEAITNMQAFIDAVRVAKKNKIPIVCLKAGASKLGAAALESHTSSIAGENHFYQSFFNDLGIAKVDSIENFIETLKLTYLHGKLANASCLTISSSGGEASLAADLAYKYGVDMPAFNQRVSHNIEAVIGDVVAIQNPLDYHTYIWGQPELQQQCFAAAHQGEHAITCKILDLPEKHHDADNLDNILYHDNLINPWYLTLDAFIKATKDSGKPAALIGSLVENMPQAVMQTCIDNGVAPLCGLDNAIQAIKAASTISFDSSLIDTKWPDQYFHNQYTQLSNANNANSLQTKVLQSLDEYDAKRLLKSIGVNVPKHIRISSEDAADQQTLNTIIHDQQLTYPLVAKICGDEILHKSELGGVILNIQSIEALQQQCLQLLAISPNVLIEEMVMDRAIELILRVKKDPLFGLIISVGFGGTQVELMNDMVHIIAPCASEEIAEKLQQLRFYPLIAGFRGQEKYQIESLIETILAIQSQLLESTEPSISGIDEIEINPLLISKTSVYTVDAIIKTHQHSQNKGCH